MSADDFVFSTLIARHPDPATASRALQLAEAAVLRRAADAISALPQDYECDPGRGDAVERLRRTAAGVEEKASATAPTATPAWLPTADVVAWLTKKSRELRSVGGPVRAAQADAVAALASKVERGAIRPDNLRSLPEEDTTDPLIVDRFDVAMEPAPDEEPVLVIGAVAADGRPVALLLDVEDRVKVAAWLGGHAVEDERRRARLLDEIRTQGGRWPTRRAQRFYRRIGAPVPRCAVRQDLAVLRERGHLRQHGPENRRYYLLATRKDGRS